MLNATEKTKANREVPINPSGRKLLLIFFFFLSQLCVAQNLVPNPSFESYINCPANLNQIYECQDWNNWGYFPDYFNSCAVNPQVSVPNNYYGFQNPASGNAYCVFLNHHVPAPLNDFMGAQLLQSLLIGQTYFVSLKISFVGFSCPTNKMGVLFSTLAYDSIHPPALNDFAHVYTDTIVTDTMNWFQIKGSFVADSNYAYIIIGNFFNNPSLNPNIFCGNIWSSWYYVDDICVSTDSMTCYSFPTKTVEQNNIGIDLFPNPTSSIFTLQTIQPFVNSTIVISNTLGEKIIEQKLISEKTEIDLSAYPKGIYFVKVIQGNRVAVKKIILM